MAASVVDSETQVGDAADCFSPDNLFHKNGTDIIYVDRYGQRGVVERGVAPDRARRFVDELDDSDIIAFENNDRLYCVHREYAEGLYRAGFASIDIAPERSEQYTLPTKLPWPTPRQLRDLFDSDSDSSDSDSDSLERRVRARIDAIREDATMAEFRALQLRETPGGSFTIRRPDPEDPDAVRNFIELNCGSDSEDVFSTESWSDRDVDVTDLVNLTFQPADRPLGEGTHTACYKISDLFAYWSDGTGRTADGKPREPWTMQPIAVSALEQFLDAEQLRELDRPPEAVEFDRYIRVRGENPLIMFLDHVDLEAAAPWWGVVVDDDTRAVAVRMGLLSESTPPGTPEETEELMRNLLTLATAPVWNWLLARGGIDTMRTLFVYGLSGPDAMRKLLMNDPDSLFHTAHETVWCRVINSLVEHEFGQTLMRSVVWHGSRSPTESMFAEAKGYADETLRRIADEIRHRRDDLYEYGELMGSVSFFWDRLRNSHTPISTPPEWPTVAQLDDIVAARFGGRTVDDVMRARRIQQGAIIRLKEGDEFYGGAEEAFDELYVHWFRDSGTLVQGYTETMEENLGLRPDPDVLNILRHGGDHAKRRAFYEWYAFYEWFRSIPSTPSSPTPSSPTPSSPPSSP